MKTWIRKSGFSSFNLFSGKEIEGKGFVFEADENDIPEGFRFLVEEYKGEPSSAPVDNPPAGDNPDETNPPVELYKVVPAAKAGFWNVVDKDEKIINPKLLRKGAAEMLKKELEANV